MAVAHLVQIKEIALQRELPFARPWLTSAVAGWLALRMRTATCGLTEDSTCGLLHANGCRCWEYPIVLGQARQLRYHGFGHAPVQPQLTGL